MRTKERLLSAIVDIQIHIKHDIDQHACAACLRWDELQAAAMKACDEIDHLRAEVEALRVIISQWYSVYTDDMQPDGDLLADTDAALRGEGE